MNVDDIAAAVIRGYPRGIDQSRPTLLDEHATWMRPAVACSGADRRAFWKKSTRCQPPIRRYR